MEEKRSYRKKIWKGILFAGPITLLFFIGCPIYEMFGIPCPCCGTTRAWLAFFCLDFSSAIQNNAFFWLIPILIIVYLRLQFFKGKERKGEIVFLLSASCILFVYNCLRWLHLVAMPLAST